MTSAIAGESCRLVICGPDRRIEVAVPTNVPVADLLPTLLRQLGDGLADTGLEHEGWVLQRLGEPPLNEDLGTAALGLRDGEIVHVRPRSEQLPPIDFDDLIDGVATGMDERSGRWDARMTRWAAVAGLLVTLGFALALIALPGPVRPRLAVAAGTAVILLVVAAVVARAGRDRAVGRALAMGAVGHSALAGLLAPAAYTSTRADSGLYVLTTAAAAAGTAVIAMLAIGGGGPALSAVVTASVLAALGGGLVIAAGLTPAAAAGVTLVSAIGLGALVPLTSFRLAGMRLAPLPVTTDDLQEEVEPEPSQRVLSRTALADRFMTGLYGGLGLAAAGAGVLLTGEPGWAPVTLAGLSALVLLLAARPMTSAWHRLAGGLPALAIGGAAVVTLAGHASVAVRFGVFGALVLVAAVLIWVARSLPGRRLMPYWGRIGDLLLSASAVALIPVLLALLGIYGLARAVGG